MKQNCPSVEELVHFLDGELSPGESTAIAKHVANCKACAQSVKELEMSLMATKACLESEISALDEISLAPAVMRKIGRPGPVTAWTRRILVAAASIAVIVLVSPLGDNPPKVNEKAAVSTKNSRPIPEVTVKIKPDRFDLEDRINGNVRAVNVRQ